MRPHKYTLMLVVIPLNGLTADTLSNDLKVYSQEWLRSILEAGDLPLEFPVREALKINKKYAS